MAISWRIPLAFFVLASPVSSQNLSSVCAYECDFCTNTWYGYDAAGRCANRTAREPAYFFVASKCSAPRMAIRDEESCQQILNAESPDANIVGGSYHAQLITGAISTSFNTSVGCKVNSANSSLFGLDRFQAEICFGAFHWEVVVGWQVAAVVVGVALGAISTSTARKHSTHFTDHLADKVGPSAIYLPGAKVVAMHSVVRSWNRSGVLFYRFFQVIANVWLPMALMWIVSPVIVLPLWVLFYWVPPFLVVGPELFSQPRHYVTPASCSLHGIAANQRSGTCEYAFSMLRPIIFVGTTILVGYLVVTVGLATGHTDIEVGTWVMNPVGFWRAGLEDRLGNIVLYISATIAIVGSIMHTLLSITPVVKSMLGMADAARVIRLDTNEKVRGKVEALAQKVCAAAVADDEDDQDRVADLEVETLSTFMVMVAVGLAIVDFFAYIYKIAVFLDGGRYPLAAVMTVALVEAMTTLVLNDHFRRAPAAFKQVAVSGVPSVDFLALVQWDDGIAGIPCLLITVYGLPLTRMKSWVTCVSSIFFLLSGTRALAKYLADVTDADMYSVPLDWSLLGDVGDEEEYSEEE